jgi:hypothetical protein
LEGKPHVFRGCGWFHRLTALLARRTFEPRSLVRERVREMLHQFFDDSVCFVYGFSRLIDEGVLNGVPAIPKLAGDVLID